MIIKFIVTGGAAFAALASTAALAGTKDAPGVYAASAITSGNLAVAERVLQPESYADAADPARLINIATVYVRTQRYSEARAALQRVQALPAEQLELSGGASYSSHAIAKAMLGRMPGTQASAK
ncbi:tetratricopeptide repeat protein [Sphingobium nicotianae]|uniref:Tetratricopeptide repeat protein n=1 Tax=Sphingobium nicotianae TaxID=2782607 RepID=A0A9X1DBZ8_9SPHN|nr:tetratricopeptide repeat protein [Sphingobium nicotianae]MBT2187144.1 tetratricopeptide repeat protein [Sphingobium nicotianae]